MYVCIFPEQHSKVRHHRCCELVSIKRHELRKPISSLSSLTASKSAKITLKLNISGGCTEHQEQCLTAAEKQHNKQKLKQAKDKTPQDKKIKTTCCLFIKEERISSSPQMTSSTNITSQKTILSSC